MNWHSRHWPEQNRAYKSSRCVRMEAEMRVNFWWWFNNGLLLDDDAHHGWILLQLSSFITMFLVGNKSTEKVRDTGGIQTQDLLNTSQMLLPLSHLDPWQRSGRQVLNKQHCLEDSAKFQLILTLSRLDTSLGYSSRKLLSQVCTRSFQTKHTSYFIDL